MKNAPKARQSTRHEPFLQPPQFTFLDWTVNLTTAELFRAGTKVPLQDKPFQVLVLLLRRPGQVVTRKQIRAAIWPDRPSQADPNLNTAIRKLRSALEDSPKQPRIIKTVGNSGYMFLPNPQPASHWPSDRDIRLLVTPLQNLSAPEFDQFADSLTEQMIVQLADPEGHVRIIEPALAPSHRQPALNLAKIAKQLRADYVLGGTMLRTGDTVRISSRLVHAADGACVWSDTHPRQIGNSFRSQDEITLRLACSILQVLPKPALMPSPVEDDSPAREKALKGRHFADQWNERSFLRAVSLLQQALAVDPDFATAHADLARTYASMLHYGFLQPDKNQQALREHARRALELRPDLSEAQVALGCAYFFYDADWAHAEESFQRALKMTPDLGYAYQTYARLLIATGRHDEAIATAQRARELDPLSPFATSVLAASYCFARRPEEGVQPCLQCIEIEPGFAMAHALLGRMYEALGRFDDAVESYRRGLECAPDSPVLMANLAHGLAIANQQTKASQLLDALLAVAESTYVPPYWLAVVNVGLGELELALRWLRRAQESRCGWRVLAAVDPMLDPIRNEPGFEDLLRGLRFPQEKAHASGANVGFSCPNS